MRKKVVSVLCSVVLTLGSVMSLFLSAGNIVHAESVGKIILDAIDCVAFAVSQLGAVATFDFVTFLENEDTFNDYIANGWTFDEDTQNITFDAEFMAYVKSALDEYAASTEGYTIYSTIPVSAVSASFFTSNYDYQTFCNIVNNSSCGMAIIEYCYRLSGVMSLDDVDFNNYSFVSNSGVRLYDNNLWTSFSGKFASIDSSCSRIYSSFDDFYSSDECSALESSATRFYMVSSVPTANFNSLLLFSNDGRNVRVYNSLSAFKSYTAGQSRNVYYTSNYYNYEAVDTTVSVSDLESIAAAVEDIADQMDTLVTISDTESEIEELLQSLLDQVVQNSTNDDGSTTSEATGSTVVYYSPVTTSWLDSVSDYLKNILEQIKESNSLLSGLVELLTPDDDETDADSDASAGDSSWLDSITEYLDNIVELLKSIKNWTVADTVADVADAVADWADFITGFFDDADSGVASVASGLSEPVELLSGKFPFSIPWDIAFLIGFLADTPATPVFEIPLVLERYGINETFVIDLSELEALSKISRLLLTVAFIIGLLKLTEKIINVKEGK